MKKAWVVLVVGAIFFPATSGSGERCGSNPSVVYLKQGEKSRIEYWTDAQVPQFQMNSVVPLPEERAEAAKASGRSEARAEYQMQSERQIRTEVSLENVEIPQSGMTGTEAEESKFRAEGLEDFMETTILPMESDAQLEDQFVFRPEYEDSSEFQMDGTEKPTLRPEYDPDEPEYEPDEPEFRPEFNESETLIQLGPETGTETTEEVTLRMELEDEPEFRPELEDGPQLGPEETETLITEPETWSETTEEAMLRMDLEDEPEFRPESIATEESETRVEVEDETEPEESTTIHAEEPEEPIFRVEFAEEERHPELSTTPEAVEFRTEKTEETSMLPDFRTMKPEEVNPLWVTPPPQGSKAPEFRTEFDPEVKRQPNPTPGHLVPIQMAPQLEAGPEVAVDVKPEVSVDVKPEVNGNRDATTSTTALPTATLSEVKPEVRSGPGTGATTVRPEVNSDAKPEVKSATAPGGRLGPEVKPEVKPEVGLEEKPEDLLVSRIHSIVESVANRRPTIMQKTSGFILHSVFRRPRERRQIVQVAAPDLSSAAGSRPTAPEDDAIWQNFMRNRKVAPSADPLLIPETLSTILPFQPVGDLSGSGKPADSGDHAHIQVSGSLPPHWKQPKKKPGKFGFRNSLVRFIESQPIPLRRALLHPDLPRASARPQRHIASAGLADPCDLHVKTEDDLHLLVTFHNLSAPYTVDCSGAYIEIERESNGFHARWCGSPIATQRGIRSHIIFARSHLRISVFSETPEPTGPEALPEASWHGTGFTADIEVVDLRHADANPHQRSGAYSSVQRSVG